MDFCTERDSLYNIGGTLLINHTYTHLYWNDNESRNGLLKNLPFPVQPLMNVHIRCSIHQKVCENLSGLPKNMKLYMKFFSAEKWLLLFFL